jgi:energy-coupling factor transport system permease protein
MSQSFEYLRLASFGQYLPLDSPVHRQDARVKLLAILIMLSACIFTQSLIGLLIGSVIALIVLRLAGISVGYALRGLLPPLPFILILSVLQVLFVSGRAADARLVDWGWLGIGIQGIEAGSMLGLRFMALILWLTLASYCLSNTELIRGLEQLLAPLSWLGISARDIAMSVQIAMRFVPFLALTMERVAKAQASRGAVWGTRQGGLVERVRQMLPLFVPLFLNGLHKAEIMALAMEARGYSNPAARKHVSMGKLKPLDWLTLGVVLGLSLVVLLI